VLLHERDGAYWVGEGRGIYASVRNSGEAIEVVKGFSDPQVAASLKAIQDIRLGKGVWRQPPGHAAQPTGDSGVARYWATHSVAFAEVRASNKPKDKKTLPKLLLVPELTLAGTFDAGLTPEVAAPADLKKFGPAKAPATGDKVVVVMERDGDSYRIAQEEPEYMPKVGDQRSPICVVREFSDPKVEELVKSLKDLRNRQRNAEGKKEPSDKGNKAAREETEVPRGNKGARNQRCQEPLFRPRGHPDNESKNNGI
jgi:hypothetical protein